MPLTRADARDNRRRILDAAELVFGAGGEEASTELVAARAGVGIGIGIGIGIGTVFRHFPTKRALLEAVLLRRLTRLREEADALAAAPDAGAAFLGYFRHTIEDVAGKISIANALLADGEGAGEAVQAASAAVREAVGQLLARAQTAGTVRPDVGLPEVFALLVGVSRAAALGVADAEVTERTLAIIFAGLRPGGAPSTGRE